MRAKRLIGILVCIVWGMTMWAADSTKVAKPSVYQGMIVKLDVGTAAIALGTSEGRLHQYELAMNWRVIQRLYPTFELGYGGGRKTQDSLAYKGNGGFFRVGLDICPFKKHPESPHALLVGVRLGTAVQDAQMANNNSLASRQWIYADCWGEIVAGCQVEIAKVNNTAFYMGWMGRFKFLFTGTAVTDDQAQLIRPMYIPGFGTRDNMGWGFCYHLGWRF